MAASSVSDTVSVFKGCGDGWASVGCSLATGAAAVRAAGACALAGRAIAIAAAAIRSDLIVTSITSPSGR
jgi:hypothetical protein